MGMLMDAEYGVEPQPMVPSAARALAGALFSTTQQRVLGLLYGRPERSFYATEVIGLVGGGSGAVQRELQRLAESGMLTVTWLGNRKHYQANPAAAVFTELRSLIRKIVVLPAVLADALAPAASDIEFALVHGPAATDVAVGTEVDLLLVSDLLDADAARTLLARAEVGLGVRVSESIYTVSEFRARTARPNTVLARILAAGGLLVVGARPR